MPDLITLLHSGDNHLGFRQYGLAAREQDFYAATTNLFRLAIDRKVDGIVLAGDVWDATKPPSAAVRLLQELVAEAKAHGIRVFAVDGNHDYSEGNWLTVCGIEHIGGKIATVVSRDGLTRMNIAGIDSCRPAMFTRTLAELKARAEGHPIPVLVIHQAVAELSDFNTEDYTALEIAGWVRPLGVQYVAMGDIHSYKETVIGSVRFAYCGAPEIKAVDESPNKSASLIMYDGSAVTTGILPLATRPFLFYDIASEADIDRLTLQVGAAAASPLVVLQYLPENRDLCRRAESVLRLAGALYRTLPAVNNAAAATAFAREHAMFQLKDAVEQYFEPGTDEHQLVFRLLNAPDSVSAVIDTYVKSKNP